MGRRKETKVEELIKAMSDEDLVALKAKYADNPSVVTLIDGILEGRAKEAVQVKARAKFEGGITKLFATLPHPDDVHNVYARWAEVDVPDGDLEEVEVEGEKVMRTPTRKEYQWVVTINHVVKVSSGGSGGSSSAITSKRAITVFKRNGLQLECIGNFASCSKACEHLGLLIGADSAKRVLVDRNGYVVEDYDGTDYTS